MGNGTPSALLSLFSVMLVWPHISTKSVSSKLQTVASTSLSAEQEVERPRVGRLMTQRCDAALDNFCLNNGQCMLLVDTNEHHCKCESGYYGPRCAHMQLVFQPMGEEQLILTIVCVSLLIIGLAGALYFCCKWYKRNRFPRQQKRTGYRGVQSA
ncbi:proepiregulin-like [Myripristis murdjan]|uniref:proepiregulin-like n=1 Tax=Myripristis murdjan TaxID=586833 RepID=UPI0011761739|nr:proepiregulin-like [Myripristis murdjan]